uniref:3'-5' exonuclease domain-containing protein n=1 Tax=Fagus sylvatica TaxID=28930 RepID=A0A2N9HDY9_FAGSY
MINNIPVSLLSNIGSYELDMQGAKVKVSVVDNSAVIDAKIEEFKSSLKTLQRRVVGLDIKFGKTISENKTTANILLLCVGNSCLIIQLLNFPVFPETLVEFLSDETICFLGGVTYFQGSVFVKCKTGVEIGYLAAKIMRKPDIEKNGLAELAGEVGMDIKQPIGSCPDWNAKVFSDEEIRYAMHNAYTSYVIGNKLFGMV